VKNLSGKSIASRPKRGRKKERKKKEKSGRGAKMMK